MTKLQKRYHNLACSLLTKAIDAGNVAKRIEQGDARLAALAAEQGHTPATLRKMADVWSKEATRWYQAADLQRVE